MEQDIADRRTDKMRWIEKFANEYAEAQSTTNTEGSTQLEITVALPEIDVGKVYNLLSKNGFPVLDICVADNKSKEPNLNTGDRVTTTASCVVGSNIMIKTPAMLYTVAHATVPAGYIGDVVSVKDGIATVLFDANITVEAEDRSGYIDTVDYYIETANIPVKDLKIL